MRKCALAQSGRCTPTGGRGVPDPKFVASTYGDPPDAMTEANRDVVGFGTKDGCCRVRVTVRCQIDEEVSC
jgi:hypothetical protein